MLQVIGSWLLKIALNWAVGSLEKKYPGIKNILDKVVAFLEGGGTTAQVSTHLESLPDVTGLKK